MDDRFGGISMDDIMNASGFDDDAQPAAPQGQQPVQAGYPQQGYPQQPDLLSSRRVLRLLTQI